MKIRLILFFLNLIFFFIAQAQCTMANYLAAVRIPIASYPYAATSAAVTVSANAAGVPTLGNSSYNCGPDLYGGASPAWWLNGATQTITLTFSQPVTSLTYLINGTNATEEFYIVSNSTCAISITNLCSVGFSSVGGTVIAGPTAGLGSIITVNNPGGATQYRMTHNGLGAGSRVTLLDCFALGSGSCVLPIELFDFKGKCNNNVVELEWETVTEKNNSYFTIERSMNGYDWIEVGKMKGSGNSASSKYYFFIDPKPNAGTLYYRLLQTDFSNERTESKIILVNSCKNVSDVVVYPNPVRDEINIVGENIQDLHLFDAYGSEIKNLKISQDETIKVSISELPGGVYFLKMGDKNFKVIKN